MKIVVTGCGQVAGSVARILAGEGGIGDLVVADRDGDAARALAADTGATAMEFDATDPASVARVVTGADVVFNGVGPFYRHGRAILDAVLDAGAHYIDICDEYDVAQAFVTEPEWDERARAAGVTVMTGCGLAPGVTNLLARWACDRLDEPEVAHVVMAVPFFADLGVTILEHMFHSTSGEVTQYLDGAYQDVPAWGDPRRFAIAGPLGELDYGYFGHPEAITLPRFVPSLRECTSRFSWVQRDGNLLYQRLAAAGLMGTEPVDGLPMPPSAYIARYLASPQGSVAAQLDVSGDPIETAWLIQVEGRKDGADATVVVEARSDLANPVVEGHEMTAIPAARFARMLIDGEITERGVLAPEGCVDPEPFLRDILPRIGVTVTSTTTVSGPLF